MAMTGLSRFAPLPLRIAGGAAFLMHGFEKLYGAAGFEAFQKQITDLNLPFSESVPPEVLAHVVAWGALAGGAFIILGFATRVVAFVNTVTVAALIWYVYIAGNVFTNLKDNFMGEGGYAFPLVMLAVALSLVLTGPGALSIDDLLFGRKAPKETQVDAQ